MTTKDEALEQPALPFGVGGGLVAIKTLLGRDPCAHAKVAIEMIDAMLSEQPAPAPEVREQQEPVRLRRGNILRCIETDELCTVWSTSTTGKTLVKWNANEFGAYTAEQIGELFWLEPEPDDLELAAEKSDNYAAFHQGEERMIKQGEFK